jgi:hypothetical protein
MIKKVSQQALKEMEAEGVRIKRKMGTGTKPEPAPAPKVEPTPAQPPVKMASMAASQQYLEDQAAAIWSVLSQNAKVMDALLKTHATAKEPSSYEFTIERNAKGLMSRIVAVPYGKRQKAKET